MSTHPSKHWLYSQWGRKVSVSEYFLEGHGGPIHGSLQVCPMCSGDLGFQHGHGFVDVVARFLGEDKALRFTDYQKPGLLQRLFGSK